MSSQLLERSETLKGKQTPSVFYLPERAGSYLDDALDLWAVAGRSLDPWQELSVDAILSYDSFGSPVCTEFGELVSRQNGKGDIINVVMLTKLFVLAKRDGSPRTVVYTAHEFKTAQEMFRRMRLIISSSKFLMGELKPSRSNGITMAHGAEGFELANGNRLLYLARSKNSGVGFTVDDLIIDEAQECSVAAMDALLPTQSAVEDTQVLFFGTVPDEINDAEYFEGVRDRGRSGQAKRTGWMEFNPVGSQNPKFLEKLNIQDVDLWRQSNPGKGYRPGLTHEYIEGEASGRLSLESFIRLRLSVWPDRKEEERVQLSELDITNWVKNNVQPDAALGDAPVYALALGKGSGYATVSAASRFDDETIFVEHQKTERGIAWVAKYLAGVKKKEPAALIVLDAKNAASVLMDLDAKKLKYLSMNLDELAAAHAQFIEFANNGLIVHRGQAEVNKSLEFAKTRAIGRSGFTWEPSDLTKPISHAQSVTWAAWGVRKRESKPPEEVPEVRGYA